MQSCLYRGWVEHRRLLPRLHRFRYSIHLLFVDLDEPHPFRGLWPFVSERYWAIHQFKSKDHGKLREETEKTSTIVSQQDLADQIRDFVQSKGASQPVDRVFLLTQFRFMGFVFNPVSFYYCFDASGQLQHVVAEVNNTPWKERYFYLLPQDRIGDHAKGLKVTGNGYSSRLEVNKDFHVSPFMSMDMRYRWLIQKPDRSLRLSIANLESEAKIFDVVLNLKRSSLSWVQLLQVSLLQPFQPQRVKLGIYWQALRLWLKKTPLYPHPKHAQDESN